ncbi:MAG: hypothetical protein WCH34_13955 [Bacteroidota bacterium]
MNWFKKALTWVDDKSTKAGEWINKKVEKVKKVFRDDKPPAIEPFHPLKKLDKYIYPEPDTHSYFNNLHNKVSEYQTRQKVHIDQYEKKIQEVFKDLYEPVTISLKNLNNKENIIDIQKVDDKVIEKSKTFEKVMTYHVNERVNENDSDFLNVYKKSEFEINEFCKKVVTESEKKILEHFNSAVIDVNTFIAFQIINEKEKWSTKIEHTTKQLKQLNGTKEEQDKAIMNIESIFLHLDLIAETLSITETQITKTNI